MVLVVSDTGPIRYLIEIGAIETLPQLFNQVWIPDIVLLELVHSSAPATVREFFRHPPPWLQVRELLAHHNLAEPYLDAGEVAAIALGLESGAELVLMDDRRGARAARRLGLNVTGTLGILLRAANMGLLELEACIEKLQRTNFHCSPKLITALLQQHREQQSRG